MKYRIFRLDYKGENQWKENICQLVEDKRFKGEYFNSIENAENDIKKYGESFCQYTVFPIIDT
jgi:hypothetical protein